MVALVSRTGRHLQRYNKGRRQVVGCIPYRYRVRNEEGALEKEEALEVLLISSSQKGKGMLFPKGGWETDESKTEAALRETVEEAGVLGSIESSELGKWSFKSKRCESHCEAFMFGLLVEEELEEWPEKNVRERKWVCVAEARVLCQISWMNEALDALLRRPPFLPHQNQDLPPSPPPQLLTCN